jgi:hypothetical protein
VTGLLFDSNVISTLTVHINTIYKANLDYKRPKGRPKTSWKDDVENDIRETGIINWRQVAQDRDGWRRETEEAIIIFDVGATLEEEGGGE